MCATTIATSCFFTSVAANGDTTNAEIEYGSIFMDSILSKNLTKEDRNKFLKHMDASKLNSNADRKVPYKDGITKREPIDEVAVYKQIENTVEKLKDKVKRRTPTDNMTKEEIDRGIANKTISKHWQKPKEWRIAKAIYRWVAQKIEYDKDSTIVDKKTGKKPYRKPQDPLYVFHIKKGVCVGKSSLVNLMMRIAGIPSVSIGTTGHAYNAIYLENTNNANLTGWTLLDSNWGNPGKAYPNNYNKWKLKQDFPGFYSGLPNFSKANLNIVETKGRKIRCIYDFVSSNKKEKWWAMKYCHVGDFSYNISGSEGKAVIEVTTNSKDLKTPLEIPDKFLKLGIPFEIGENVKSIVLQGNEILDLSKAKDLVNIDTRKSSEYASYDATNKKLVKKNTKPTDNSENNKEVEKTIEKTDNKHSKERDQFNKTRNNLKNTFHICHNYTDNNRNLLLCLLAGHVKDTLAKNFDIKKAEEYEALANGIIEEMAESEINKFTTWLKSYNKWKNDIKNLGRDITKLTIGKDCADAMRLTAKLKKEFDIDSFKNFKNLANNSIDKMSKNMSKEFVSIIFDAVTTKQKENKSLEEKAKQEIYQQAKNKYKNKVLDFVHWKKGKPSTETLKIKNATDIMHLVSQMNKKFDSSKVNEFVGLVEDSVTDMDQIMKEFDSKNQKNQ